MRTNEMYRLLRNLDAVECLETYATALELRAFSGQVPDKLHMAGELKEQVLQTIRQYYLEQLPYKVREELNNE